MGFKLKPWKDRTKDAGHTPEGYDPLESWKFVAVLGCGGQGRVELRQLPALAEDGFRAFKFVSGDTPLNTAEREATILREHVGEHENIIFCYRHFKLVGSGSSGVTVISLDWADGGDLAALLGKHHARGERLPRAFLLHLLRGLAAALAHLHARGVVHRDIKPHNVLLDWPHRSHARAACYPTVKLADFGIAAVEEGPGAPCARQAPETAAAVTARCAAGSPAYQPPEQQRAGGRGADVWAVGAVLHEAATGWPPVKPPPAGVTTSERAAWWRSGSSRQLTPIDAAYGADLHALMRACMRWDPANRISAAALVTALEPLAAEVERDFCPLPSWARSEDCPYIFPK